MSLLEQLEQDYIVAYKAKDSVRLSVLRLLKTALKNFQVEHMRPPADDDAMHLISKQCKQRQDSMEQFGAAGRQDLVDKESAEYDVLCSYMPAPLEGAELDAAIKAAIAETDASGMKDMGRVMQSLMATYKTRVDGKNASNAVRAALQKV